jgi:hypothetical protein
MDVVVEVRPPSPHGIRVYLEISAGPTSHVEFDVDVVDPRNEPRRPFTVKPSDLVSCNSSLPVELVDVGVETCMPSTFL